MLFNTEGYHNSYSTSTNSQKTHAEIVSLQALYPIFPLKNHIPVFSFQSRTEYKDYKNKASVKETLQLLIKISNCHVKRRC